MQQLKQVRGTGQGSSNSKIPMIDIPLWQVLEILKIAMITLEPRGDT